MEYYGKVSDRNFKAYEKYFVQYLPLYLFPLEDEFIQFLKKISSKKKFHRMVTEKILYAYEESSLNVNTKILPFVFISQDLTDYIPKNRIRSKKGKISL